MLETFLISVSNGAPLTSLWKHFLLHHDLFGNTSVNSSVCFPILSFHMSNSGWLHCSSLSFTRWIFISVTILPNSIFFLFLWFWCAYKCVLKGCCTSLRAVFLISSNILKLVTLKSLAAESSLVLLIGSTCLDFFSPPHAPLDFLGPSACPLILVLLKLFMMPGSISLSWLYRSPALIIVFTCAFVHNYFN